MFRGYYFKNTFISNFALDAKNEQPLNIKNEELRAIAWRQS